jgi:glycosyltransferase involved in cell wall biosynthesis
VTDGVFIAMPVYRGVEVIAETLRSIRDQTLDDIHLVMSVDGSDDPTIDICKEFISDPRFDLVTQEQRLGWPGNFNRLVELCDRPFFCYWQQDDLASTNYLEVLRKELLAQPKAAIAYTDVQWFGASFDRTSLPNIEGDPLQRVLQHIEAIRYEPLRGLMRASTLPTHPDAIPVTDDESCQEEFVFLTEMAAAGSFVRTDQAMYFKRLHRNNVFVRWQGWPGWRRRRGWISMGAGMYEIARSLAADADSPRLLGLIIDRLAVDRPGRAFFYLPPETPTELERFVRDFTAFAQVDDFGHPQIGSLERPVHSAILSGLGRVRRNALERIELAHQLATEGSVSVGPDRLETVLGYGWSVPEPWGVWSDGEEATLWFRSLPGTPLRVTVEGRIYATSRGTSRVGYTLGDGPMQYIEALPDEPLRVVVDCPPNGAGEQFIRFKLPDARSPLEDAMSADARVLGIGLARFTMESQ